MDITQSWMSPLSEADLVWQLAGLHNYWLDYKVPRGFSLPPVWILSSHWSNFHSQFGGSQKLTDSNLIHMKAPLVIKIFWVCFVSFVWDILVHNIYIFWWKNIYVRPRFFMTLQKHFWCYWNSEGCVLFIFSLFLIEFFKDLLFFFLIWCSFLSVLKSLAVC